MAHILRGSDGIRSIAGGISAVGVIRFGDREVDTLDTAAVAVAHKHNHLDMNSSRRR